MNGFKIFLSGFVLMLAFGIVLAQEEVATPETAVLEAVNLDENIQPADLEISEPRILPDSPFYFLKNLTREIQQVFIFNPVRKAELRMKFANEKLIEVKKLVELKKNLEVIKKAIENYRQEIERIKNQVDRIRDKARENPRVENFLDKFIHQQTLHQKLLDRLEIQVPKEAFEKIRQVRERHLERFKDVMLKLEDRKEKIGEKLDRILEKQKGSDFKEFKNLEVLKRVEEIVPEEAKEAIKTAQENVLKRLERKLEEMPTEKQEQLKEYIEKISGEKEKHLEIFENLRFEIQEKLMPFDPISLIKLREKLIKQIEEKLDRLNCHHWVAPAPEFCEGGRVIIEKDPKTRCLLPPKCIFPGELGIPLRCIPICQAIGTKKEGWYDSCSGRLFRLTKCEKCTPMCNAVGTRSEGWYDSCTDELIQWYPCGSQKPPIPKPDMVCLNLWDPVCGKDGKTYSNECFAKLAGVEIDYKGRCKETDTDYFQFRCGPRDLKCPKVR